MVERPRPVAWMTVGRRAKMRAGMAARCAVEANRFMGRLQHGHQEL
jgi:hypothetical protein